jgi:hypothetical protein
MPPKGHWADYFHPKWFERCLNQWWWWKIAWVAAVNLA